MMPMTTNNARKQGQRAFFAYYAWDSNACYPFKGGANVGVFISVFRRRKCAITLWNKGDVQALSSKLFPVVIRVEALCRLTKQIWIFRCRR